MDRLNQYQKIQVILLVSIIIAAVVLVISFVKNKEVENYTTEQTFADMTSVVNEALEENMTENEDEEGNIDEEDTSWDEEAEDTKVDVTEENIEENDSTKYYLKVNYTANVVTAYTKDNSGKYTVPVRAMLCSTGKATPTSGVYKMSNKYRWHQLNGGVYGQYCSRITGHILFHSVPYKTNSPDTLKYAAYDKLGTKASAGCIRLTVQDALWIYQNCASGTYVEFYSSSNPGPLGKPTAKKISSNEKCRNWDPTDPLAGNPWHSYVEPASAPVETPKQEEQNNNQPEIQNQDKPSGDNENNNHNNEQEENNNNVTEKPEEPEPPKKDENGTNNNTSSETTGNNTVGQNVTKNETSGNNTTSQNVSENEATINEIV